METIDDEKAIKLLKDHLEIEISNDIEDFGNVDCLIYEESTVDGYSVYIVTNDDTHISVCEDIYYYDHDIPNAFEEQIRYGDRTFYIDASIYDDCYFDDKLLEMFTDHIEDIVENGALELTEKEINELKEEYGIEDEEEETITPIIT